MSLGQNFPISEYYKGKVIDAVTIKRGGGWWTAALLIEDPKTNRPFVGLYRWQLCEDGWKVRKSIRFKQKAELDKLMDIFSEFEKKMR